MKQKAIMVGRVALPILIALALLERVGIFNGTIDLTTFVYYTNLSNLLVLSVSGYTAYKMWQAISKNKQFQMNQTLSKLRIATTVLILITGLVYHFVLYPQYRTTNPDYNWLTFYNIISHYVAPIVMFLDWLFIDEKRVLNKLDPAKWVAIPAIYVVYALVYGLIGPIIPNAGSTYPYFFLDIDKTGILGVAGWVVILLLFFLVVNYLMYLLNYLLLKRKMKQKNMN